MSDDRFTLRAIMGRVFNDATPGVHSFRFRYRRGKEGPTWHQLLWSINVIKEYAYAVRHGVPAHYPNEEMFCKRVRYRVARANPAAYLNRRKRMVKNVKRRIRGGRRARAHKKLAKKRKRK